MLMGIQGKLLLYKSEVLWVVFINLNGLEASSNLREDCLGMICDTCLWMLQTPTGHLNKDLQFFFKQNNMMCG